MLAVIKLVFSVCAASCNLPTAVEQIAHYAYAALCSLAVCVCECCLCHLGKHKYKHHLTTVKACLPVSESDCVCVSVCLLFV